MNEDHYALTVKIRKRTDLEQPTSMEEAVSMVAGLLSNGSFLEVLSVEPWWVAYEEAEGIDWGDE